MKICYLTQSIVPSSLADSVQSMNMCNGLAQAGHEVTMISPDRPLPEPVGDSPHAYYGLPESFALHKIPWTLIAGRSYLYGYHAARECKRLKPDMVYSRSIWEAMFAVCLGMPTIFEAHAPISGRVTSGLFRVFLKSRHLRRIVVISEALGQHIQQQHQYPSNRIVLARDAADIPDRLFSTPVIWPGREAHLQAGYVGSLVEGRGLDLIGEMAATLPAVDFHIVGGSPGQIAFWTKRMSSGNVYFHGSKKPGEIPGYLDRFDILLAPYQKKVMIGLGDYDTTKWMSPMKLFEYMAAGKAIVCSDLPALREFMRHDDNAILCPPEDTVSWCAAVRRLSESPTLQESLGLRARNDVERYYTWKMRAQTVLHGITTAGNI